MADIKEKTIPTSLTGGGGSIAAGWRYELGNGCKSVSIKSTFTGTNNGKTITQHETTNY